MEKTPIGIPMDSLVSPAPFICSLSKRVRAGIAELGLDGEGIRRAVVGIIKQVEANTDLKVSLKQKPEPGCKILRQIDIRFTAEGPIQFKCFVSWNWGVDCWHVFVEGADESPFENGELNW